MKKLLIIILLFSQVAYGEQTVGLTEEYTAEDIYALALVLTEQYPDILNMEIIGHSNDGRPIFVLQLTENVKDIQTPETYVDKYHLMIEGGIHSRENVSPVMLLKMVEVYAADYYDEGLMPTVAMGRTLKRHVFHFIVLSNPDGYNLANHGIETLSAKYQRKLRSFNSQNFTQYKSNANGVDLNRNFPGLYYDQNAGVFKNIWNKVHNDYRSYVPGAGFYFGPYAGSEPETQALMAYLTSYDFRNYVSYHSRGEVIYWYKWMLSDTHNWRTKLMTQDIADLTGYTMTFTDKGDSSSGYMTDYTAMITLKPSITIETVSQYRSLPAGRFEIVKAYSDNLLVPIVAAKHAVTTGYFDHKLYIDGAYVRDYESLVDAKAWADRLAGRVVSYDGVPIYEYSEDLKPISRLEAVELLVDRLQISSNRELLAFEDCADEAAMIAKALGIVSGYQNFFYPEQPLTYEGAYVMVTNVLQRPDHEVLRVPYAIPWAREAVSFLVTHDVVDFYKLKNGVMTRHEFLTLLENGMLLIDE